MRIGRRDFIKGCAAVSALSLPVMASTAEASAAEIGLHIEKSIKASFGGGFAVLSHHRSKGLTQAEITHFGNRYTVASADLQDWKIIRSSLSNPGFASPLV
ncbi:twin-arginine translocation signal domain-containing protein [Brucella endophytica]|nr:twin-arginine translocation signal domain-containing protein [Brucella endophytica]